MTDRHRPTQMFRISLRDEPWPKGYHKSRICPVCGYPWRPWANSRLNCHCECLWTDAGALWVADDPRSQQVQATELRVTVPIIRVGIRKGRAIRQARRALIVKRHRAMRSKGEG